MDRRLPPLGRIGGGGTSEYQYYEFLALDRPLTGKQRAELRSLSTHAEDGHDEVRQPGRATATWP